MQQHRDLPAAYHRNASTATLKPQIVSDKARHVQHPIYSQLFQPERKRRPDSHRSVFSAWFCIRNHQSGTPCRHAFGIAGFERLASRHSESPERNAMPACFRVCQSGTPCRHAFAFAGAERNARKPGKTAFAVKLRVGQRAGNGVHASGIFTIKIVERLGIAAEQPHARHLLLGVVLFLLLLLDEPI